jgi:hypothetical protein
MHHDFANREPSVALPRPPPKLSSKQIAAKMLSRAPPPIVQNTEFDEEDETPNSGMRHSCACVALRSPHPSGTWLTITKHTPQHITTCVPG